MEITGLVQGVGFRWFTRDEAENSGVAGYVRNSGSNSVEIEAEADETTLAAFVTAVKKGPQGSNVTDVKTVYIPVTGERGFEILI